MFECVTGDICVCFTAVFSSSRKEAKAHKTLQTGKLKMRHTTMFISLGSQILNAKPAVKYIW